MKVLAINTSPRKDGNTATLVRRVFQELESEGIDTHLEQLGKTRLSGCIACYKCIKRQDRRCAVTRDAMNGLIEAMLEADGIILASPVYLADVTANARAVIERAGYVARNNRNMFSRKVGGVRGGLAAQRRHAGLQLPERLFHEHRHGRARRQGLEHGLRPGRGRCGEGSGGHGRHGASGPEHGLAAAQDPRLTRRRNKIEESPNRC